MLILVARAHPSVDGHLHEVEVRCAGVDGGRVTDPMEGTVAAIRRAGVLSDAGRTDEALAELDRACVPEAEVTRLARARTLLHGGRPAEALAAVDGLSGADATLWRAQAMVALGREGEAGALLASALPDLHTAPPEAYLETADLVSPCTAVAVLDLGLARRGDVASLRRASASAAFACGVEPDPLARLRDDDARDLLLRGDLLERVGRTNEARRAWQNALRLVAAQRRTPAQEQMSQTLSHRLATSEEPR